MNSMGRKGNVSHSEDSSLAFQAIECRGSQKNQIQESKKYLPEV